MKYHILDKKLHEKSAKVIMLDVWAGLISTRSLPYLWSFELLPFIRLLFALLNALLLENNISEAMSINFTWKQNINAFLWVCI